MLRKIEGRSRRGQQRMKWLDGIIDIMDMSLGHSEGQGSLACCTLWGGKESDTTECVKNNKTASYVEMKHQNILFNEWFLAPDLHSELNNRRRKISHLRLHFWNPVFFFCSLSLRHPTFHCFAICAVKYAQIHWLDSLKEDKMSHEIHFRERRLWMLVVVKKKSPT